MKKKFLAVLSLVMVLAMESVTVFASESPTGSSGLEQVEEQEQTTTTTTTTTPATTVTTPDSGDVLYGNVESTTTEELTIDNLDVAEITDNVEVATATDENGNETIITVDTNSNDEWVFERKEKGEDKGEGVLLSKKTTGEVKNETLLDIKLNKDQGHETKPLTDKEKKESTAVVRHADSIGKANDANLDGAYFVSAEGSVDERTGKPDKPVTFDVPNANNNIKSDNCTIIHIMENGKTENLGATYSNGKITSVKTPSSYSPFILLVFDKPVPGLTTEIDYTTQSSALTNGVYSTESATNSGTIAGAVSPKTNDAYPYAACVALIALACGLVCTRKLAKN
jgi:hypothetical protein